MKNTIVVMLLCASVYGCNNPHSNNKFRTIDDISIEPLSLSVHPINTLIGNPNDIYVRDSLLILCDVVDNTAILIYDIKNQRELIRNIREGNGPGEVILPLSMHAAGENIGLLQRQTGNYKTYSIVSLLSGSVKYETNIDIPGGADVANLTEEGIVSCNYYNNGVLQFSDKYGEIIDNYDIYPEYLSISTNSAMENYRVGQGKVGYNSQTNRLIFATSFTGQINTYNWEKRNLSLISSISIGKKGTNDLNQDDIIHSRQIWVAKDCFYVLYLGAQIKDIRNNDLPSYIIKINNDGKINHVWKSERRLSCFCISDDQTRIWGVGLSDDYEYEILEGTI